MGEDSPTEMEPEELEAFLDTGGTGVLSLSAGDDASPHAVPVSYGYDAVEEAFYFRLAVGADSEKGELTDRPVTFVAYSEADGWESVVAHGRLESVEETADDSETLAGLGRVHIPLVDVFDQPLDAVEFTFARLEPDRLTGRQELFRTD